MSDEDQTSEEKINWFKKNFAKIISTMLMLIVLAIAVSIGLSIEKV